MIYLAPGRRKKRLVGRWTLGIGQAFDRFIQFRPRIARNTCRDQPSLSVRLHFLPYFLKGNKINFESMTGTKAAKKKRNVSKHVLKARSGAGQSDGKKKEASPGKRSRNVKSPAEAASYLTEWENRGTNEAWKFNKNTQSWLIRHMYETESVSKGTFSSLLKYLDGLQGASTRSRIRAEASRRALRYKEYTKDVAAEEATTISVDAPTGDQPDSNDASLTVDTKPLLSKDEMSEDQKRWESLDEHDRRKEYKRARQILENVVSKD